MKVALVVFALVGLALSAPQPRKLFHEHFDEFIDIIMDNSIDDLNDLAAQYWEYDEFKVALEYATTKDFKNLVYEMEALPEFQAVVEFLENDNIDIHYFIDFFNEALDNMDNIKRRASHRIEASGTDFRSYVEDCISVFPKDKLSALYDQKMAEDEEFRTAIENLQGDEWDAVFSALWDNEVFQLEVQTLADHGIDIHALMHEIVAIFGQ